MNKKVNFGARPSAGKPADPDRWVQERAPEPATEKPPMKRLTIDLPAELHARLKAECAIRGVKMADEIRSILADRLTPFDR